MSVKLTPSGIRRHIAISLFLLMPISALANNSDWQSKAIVQGYFQNYTQSESREATYNFGVYLFADYLERFSLSAGYNYTYVDLTQNTEVDENMFYLGGKYSWFSDAMSGKLSLVLDGYGGEYVTKTSTTSGGGGMGGMGGMSRLTTSESTAVSVIQPQITFINFAKTFYLDIGYAFSKYDSGSTYDIDANQITPTIGWGWNNAFDWLQVRGYFINVDQQTQVFNDNNFTSAEIKYIHWFEEKQLPYFDNLRFILLVGDRALAVDPDAKSVYSVSEKQTGAASIAGQWKLDQSLKFMLLVSYEQFENDLLSDQYDSWLIYGNFETQW